MPTHGPDLSRLSLSQLAAVTGADRRSVRQKLAGLAPVEQTGRELRYDSQAALKRIYIGDDWELDRERTRLAKEQADAQAMKNAVEREELGRWEDVESFVVTVFSACVQRLGSVASKCAPEAHAAPSIAATESVIRAAVDDARRELSDVLSGKRPWRGPR